MNGAFTAGLLVSGTIAPTAGRLIDRRGGRFVLCAGSLLGAIAMGLLALAHHPAVMVAGWLVAGAAMAACLYDPAFATLSQHAGARYRLQRYDDWQEYQAACIANGLIDSN